MRLRVEHVTVYRYDPPARGVVQSHRLQPSNHEGQRVIAWDVTVSEAIRGSSFRDGAGDLIRAWTVPGPVSEITVTVLGEVDTADLAGVLRGHRETVPPLAYLCETPQTRADAALAALAREVDDKDGQLSLAHGLSAAISAAIAYRPGVTQAATTAAEALALGEGVCQDHAQALIGAARFRGLPARYVTGYLHRDGPDAPGEAAHAWAEIHVERLGWVGFDPANRCCPDERYIRIGSGIDARDAAPIRGSARSIAEERLDVSVAVRSVQQ